MSRPWGSVAKAAMSSSLALAASVAALGVIALLLAVLLLQRFRRDRQLCYLYWGAGIALVFVTLAQEAALYAGVWSQLLVRSYLVLVAVLVGVLSLGSAELALRGWWRRAWMAYMVVTGVAVAVVAGLYSVSTSILVHGVVSGLPPTPDTIASSFVTFPASGLLIVSSLYAALRQKRPRLLFITAGTLVIAAAGSLYIATFPLTLYYAEFVGVALLFLGFVNVPLLPASASRPASS